LERFMHGLSGSQDYRGILLMSATTCDDLKGGRFGNRKILSAALQNPSDANIS